MCRGVGGSCVDRNDGTARLKLPQLTEVSITAPRIVVSLSNISTRFPGLCYCFSLPGGNKPDGK